MSPMPEGWSVDVEGTRVVIRVPGRPDDVFYLSAREARMVRIQLHLAYLTAFWRRRSVIGSDQPEPESRRDSSDPASQGTDSMSSQELRPSIGLYDDLSPAPEGWSIDAVGRWVHLEVPASAADGVFNLMAGEALTVGIALIRGSERVRWVNGTVGDDVTGRAQSAAEFDSASAGIDRQIAFAAERAATLAEADNAEIAAEDQAWVDDISDFNDEGSARDPETEAGDQG